MPEVGETPSHDQYSRRKSADGALGSASLARTCARVIQCVLRPLQPREISRMALHPSLGEGRATASPSKGWFASGVSTRYAHQSAHDRPVACSETDDRDRYPKGRSRHGASRVESYRVRFRVVAVPVVVAGSAKRTDRPLAEEPGRGGLRSRAQSVRRTARRSRLPSRPFPKRAALA